MDLVEHIQLLYDFLQTLVLIPYEIETKLVSLLVLQVYIKVMIHRNIFGDAVECDIVKDYRSGLGVNHGDWFMIRWQDG